MLLSPLNQPSLTYVCLCILFDLNVKEMLVLVFYHQGVLRIHFLEAQELLGKDKFLGGLIKGKSDPYGVIKVGTKLFKSKVIHETVNPKWMEVYEVGEWRNFSPLLLPLFLTFFQLFKSGLHNLFQYVWVRHPTVFPGLDLRPHGEKFGGWAVWRGHGQRRLPGKVRLWRRAPSENTHTRFCHWLLLTFFNIKFKVDMKFHISREGKYSLVVQHQAP